MSKLARIGHSIFLGKNKISMKYGPDAIHRAVYFVFEISN